nr:DUF975 family protein [Treponema socranskii]
MFDRKKYKSFARIQLKNRRTVPVFMTLITALVVLLLSLPLIKLWLAMYSELLQASALSLNKDALLQIVRKYQKATPLDSFLPWLVFFTIAVCAIAQFCVYLKMSRTPNPVSFGDFFAGFAHWFRAIRAALWCWLWTYLWMLLFIIPCMIISFAFIRSLNWRLLFFIIPAIIPGIVKAIAYSQTFFIVAEFPHVPVMQALDISKKITRGHKADLFVLYLSFLGWYLLCVLTLGIASLWVVPYQTMTCVNAYHALMKSALESGVVTAEDIGDVNGEHYGKQ